MLKNHMFWYKSDFCGIYLFMFIAIFEGVTLKYHCIISYYSQFKAGPEMQ